MRSPCPPRIRRSGSHAITKAIILAVVVTVLSACGADTTPDTTPDGAADSSPDGNAGAADDAAERGTGEAANGTADTARAATSDGDPPRPLDPWSPKGRVLGIAERGAGREFSVSGDVVSVDLLNSSATEYAAGLLVTLADSQGTGDPWIIALDFALETIETPHAGYNAKVVLGTNGGSQGAEEPDGSTDNNGPTNDGGSTAERETLFLVLTQGNRRVFLTEGIVGFRPDTVRVETASGIGLERLILSDRAYIGEDTVMPAIPADLGTMNFYDTDFWRRDDFELFVWNVVPDVLMLDFADYDVQKRMFGRLGFFVAAAGEVGQVYEYSYYENMHAYNAQAYKTEDLALFFNTVVDKGLEFTDEEEFLRRLLVDYGILTVAQDDLLSDGETPRLTTGDGAIISIAQATFRPLRQQLLRHEAAHGLFYVDASYRQRVFTIWENLDPDIERFWELFLGNKGRLDNRQNYDGYNIANLVTMVDEMHAHTIQLPINAVHWYFHDHYMGVMRRVLPEANAFLDGIAENHTDSFVELRAEIAGAFENSTDIPGGLMLAVYPESYGQYR